MKTVPSVLWVYPDSLVRDLHSTSRLEVTAELGRLGWDVTLAAREVPSREPAGGVRAVSIPRPRIYFAGLILFHLLLLRHIIRSPSSYDVIVSEPESAPFLLPIAIFRRLLGRSRPKIVTDWRTVAMNADFSLKGKLRKLFYAVVHHLVNGFADGQTAITRRLAEMVGIPDRALLAVWPSGVKAEQFRPALSMRSWPHSHEPLRLIYLGVLEAERNILGLCEAVRLARLDGIAVTLDIVGNGSQKQELEDYVGELRGGSIALRAPVDHSLAPQILSTAHVGVLPFPDKPQFRVSSPIKLFEYMAAGLPILATRIVCHTDVLGDQDWVFWAGDGTTAALVAAIREASARKAELASLSERIADAAQAWTWQASARSLDDGLARLIGDVPAEERILRPVGR